MNISKLPRLTKRVVLLITALVFVLSLQSPVTAEAMSARQRQLYNTNMLFYDIGGACQGLEAAKALQTGSSNAEIAFKTFVNDGGYDAIHAAAIVGNLLQESNLDPTATNPDGGAHGIVQWMGGRLTAERAWTKANGMDPDSLEGQLGYAIHEAKEGIGAYKDEEFRSKSTLQDATDYWNKKYEVSGQPTEPRLKKAQAVLDEFGDQVTSVSPTNPCGGVNPNTGSANCQSAVGSQKIICEAQKYDDTQYTLGGGHGGAKRYHEKCPTINFSAACQMDCSGLVSVAVYDAFGLDKDWVVHTFFEDPKNWKEIGINEVQPGDLLVPTMAHVEIIDHISGTTIYTFGAHNPNYALEKQVGAADYYKVKSGNRYLRYIGQGS